MSVLDRTLQHSSHVVGRGCVLVGSGVLVGLIGDFDESEGIDVEGEAFAVLGCVEDVYPAGEWSAVIRVAELVSRMDFDPVVV